MTLVLLAALLPSVSTAADCGFVLWAEDSWVQTGGTSVYWTLIQTESSLAQCETNSRAKIESVAESLRKSGHVDKVEIKGNIVSEEVKRENFYSGHTIRYLCVPGMIDPRPKARD
jgi:hypothetical protein